MNRKQFIQTAVANCLPELLTGSIGFDKAVRGAERAWEALSERGHGDARQRPVEPSTGWYKSMQPHVQRQFDRFYTEYGLKKDRDAAAKAWLSIADMDDAMVDRIVVAAAMARRQDEESAAKDPQFKRKYPEGWLRARRFEDFDVDRVKVESKGRHVLRLIADKKAEIRSIEQLNINGTLEDQLGKARSALEQLEKEARAGGVMLPGE